MAIVINMLRDRSYLHELFAYLYRYVDRRVSGIMKPLCGYYKYILIRFMKIMEAVNGYSLIS